MTTDQKTASLDLKLRAKFPCMSADLDRPTFIFVDHSNVIWSFLRHLKTHRPSLDVHDEARFGRVGTSRPKLRLDYSVLFRILERGRRMVLRKYIAASNPLYQAEVISDWELRGYEIAIVSRVGFSKESLRMWKADGGV